MYKKPFYITKPVWNNAFSYENRKNKKLYVPSLIKSKIDDILLWDEIAFEDYDFDDKLSTNIWLKNFYEIEWKWKKIFLFDNHNHAFYFWYLARHKWIIWDNNTLVHIDEHTDIADNNKFLMKPDSEDLQKVFDFTNFVLNVWDYIIPAEKEWIIDKTIQVRGESSLKRYLKLKDELNENIILNLDLDFFQPDLDYIDYNMKKQVVLDAADRASVITIATSPFFIEQELALKVFKDIFS